MTIAFFDVKENWELKEIKKIFPKNKLVIYKETLQEVLDKGVDLSKVKCISVFIYSKCNKKNLDKLKDIELISTRSTGYDHISLDECKKRKIKVTNVPSYGEHTVAEFNMALLLTITRKIPQSIDRTRSGLFDFTGLRGVDLFGKTVGIVGFGKIGRSFALMCKSFGMKVIIYDISRKFATEKAKEMGVEYATLSRIYKESDIISLHLPLTPKTKKIINKKSLDQMKHGVILLNTARGDLVESKSLLQALKTGKVSFAGLDVIQGETLVKDEMELVDKEDRLRSKNYELLLHDHILMNHPNVILTPHNAFNSIDALKRILTTSNNNILNFTKKKLNENIIV